MSRVNHYKSWINQCLLLWGLTLTLLYVIPNDQIDHVDIHAESQSSLDAQQDTSWVLYAWESSNIPPQKFLNFDALTIKSRLVLRSASFTYLSIIRGKNFSQFLHSHQIHSTI